MTAKIYRKRPVEIEALQFTGDNWEEMQEFCGTHRDTDPTNEVPIETFTPAGTNLLPIDGNLNKAELWVQANESWLPIEPGEWVIHDQLGFYPCKDKQFRETYDEVEDPDESFLLKLRREYDENMKGG